MSGLQMFKGVNDVLVGACCFMAWCGIIFHSGLFGMEIDER